MIEICLNPDGGSLFGQTDGEDVFGDDGYKRFDFGLLDINDGVSAKNRNLTLSVGYKF